MENGSKHITISDVAQALNVSKTTVSRAISGKGRIGEETRERVLAYIKEHDYKPNVIAKGLAQSKTFNLCVVIPGDYAVVDLPFFQEAIVGVQEIAGEHEYDILLCICQGNDIVSLKRIIMNRKVDGVILLRTLGIYSNHIEDNMAEYLIPQECGNKCGVRYATVTDKKGRGMLFEGDELSFSALPFTPHELENAAHPYELPNRHYTVVRVAQAQMGIGGDDSWGALVHSEYLLDVSKKKEFTFRFKGI